MSAVVLGIVVSFGAYLVMATIGVDYGIPGQVATRMTFGIRGGKLIPSVVRTSASVFQFAFQTIAGALAIAAVLSVWVGVSVSLLTISLSFAVLQVVVAAIGYNTLKNLSRFAFPVKVLILGYLVYILATHNEAGYAPAEVFSYSGEVGWQWALFALWLSSTAGAWLSMITDAADFCRYSKSRTDMWIGTMSAAVVGAFVGAYGAAATSGRISNTFEIIPDISATTLTLILVLVVVLDNWTINVLNLYTAGLSVSNIFTSLGRFWATLIVSVLGVGLSMFTQLADSFAALGSALGAVFAPIAGILIVDYLLVKRSRIDILSLFSPNGSYWYTRGFNLVAVAWTVIGVGIYMVAPVVALQSVVTVLIVGAGYYATLRVVAHRSPSVREAAKPGEQRQIIAPEDVRSVM